MRWILVLAAVLWGWLFAGAAEGDYAGFGKPIYAGAAGLLVAAGPAWPWVRRRARGLAMLGVAGVFFVQLSLFCVGLASLAASGGVPLAVGVGAAVVVAGIVRVRSDLPRYDAAWERERARNEREVLDLASATYDASRPFAPLARPGKGGSTIARTSDAATAASRLAPLIAVAALAAVLGGGGVLGTWLVAGLGLAGALAFAPALAQVLVHLRRLRGYERRLGRPILNR